MPSSSSESLCYSGAIAVRLLFALLLITGLARAQELHLRWSEDPVGQPVWHRMELLPEVPAGFGAPTEAKAPRFAVSFLGGKRVYLAIDGDRLWLDRTFLGKFDQTKPFKAEPVGDWLRTEALFPIKLCAGEAEREVPLEIEWSGDELRCRMLLWRRGHALIDGRVRPIGLRDVNGDWRFDLSGGDEVLVDLDGDGRWETGEEPPAAFEPYRGDPILAGKLGQPDELLIERYGVGRAFDLGQRRYRVEAGGPHGWNASLSDTGRADPPDAWTLVEWELIDQSDPRDPLRGAAATARDREARTKALRGLAHEMARADQTRPMREAAAGYFAVDGDPEGVDLALSIAVEAGQATRDTIVARLALERRPETLTVLMRRVRHGDPDLRLIAIRALSRTPGADIDRALFDQLRKEKKAHVLGPLQAATRGRADPEMIELFRKDLRRAESFQDRAAAASRLVGLGTAHDSVREAMLAVLDEPGPWEARVFLLDALRRIDPDDLFGAVVRCLRKPQRAVRMAAAESLARTRRVEAIPALIDALGLELEPGARERMAEALYSLTGEELGDSHRLWKHWWRDHGLKFRVPAEPPAPKADRPVRRVPGERRSVATFFGLPVRESQVVFVIDQSTSMSKQPRGTGRTRLEIAKQELLSACAKLPKGARFNLICFHREIWTWRKTMVNVSPSTLGQLEREIRSLVPTGTTALFDGLEAALAVPDVRAIYLLSDGEPFGGRFDDPEEILREVAFLNQLRRARIHCVSIERKSELLQRLAAAHGGRYTER